MKRVHRSAHRTCVIVYLRKADGQPFKISFQGAPVERWVFSFVTIRGMIKEKWRLLNDKRTESW